MQEADQDGLKDNFRSQSGAEIGKSSGNHNFQQFSSLKLLLTSIVHHHGLDEDWCAWKNHDFHDLLWSNIAKINGNQVVLHEILKIDGFSVRNLRKLKN